MRTSFMRLMGYAISLTMMIFTFSMLLDLFILKGKHATIFVEENVFILYLELFLSFYAIVFIARKTYEESLVFWRKKFKLDKSH